MAFTPFVETDQPTMSAFNQKFLDAIQQATEDTLAAGPKIATGSYVGTGTYGADHPNTLTFEFEPKMVVISGQVPNSTSSNHLGYVIFVPGMTKYAPFTSEGYYQEGTVSFDGDSVSWWALVANNVAGFQLNVSGRTYNYLAIG